MYGGVRLAEGPGVAMARRGHDTRMEIPNEGAQDRRWYR